MTLSIPRVLQAWEAEGIPVGGEDSARTSPGAGAEKLVSWEGVSKPSWGSWS